MSSILKEPLGDGVEPLRKGGITFYPSCELGRIFDWVEASGRTIERIEGVFYRPETHEGQLSSFIRDRNGKAFPEFRLICLALAEAMEAEAAKKSMGAYFEVVISN